jgi:hypothetical protein
MALEIGDELLQKVLGARRLGESGERRVGELKGQALLES